MMAAFCVIYINAINIQRILCKLAIAKEKTMIYIIGNLLNTT